MRFKKLTEDQASDINRACCNCRHFRMWSPEPDYCTIKKINVDPLTEKMPCFLLRKGLPVIEMEKE